ncbi:hypothetical protein IE53DRAFT_20544 [Violaceomyces palustris]|uniref:Uncharacterized protein n=1 Tax=Violaceomyces palustris TaxID=1673888 RepID=A0ACD0NLD3_9BASI|nr:hypothetical protein IE53DRAFT_20544 [Violaceomyces palustris]
MEDSLALNKALAIAYGFDVMQLPGPASSTKHQKPDQDLFIDLWPIQIASPDADESHAWDTYTMVLQLGTILSLTGTWKSHKLRVSVFVENEWEIEDERKRVRSLLDNLRIPASLRVFSLDSGSILSYQSIVLGRRSVSEEHELALKGDPWWEALKQLRKDEERRARAAAKRKSQPPAQAIPNAPSETRKQTKREQRLLGVSLPAEHLAFYKQNIRLGLAHPRSRLRGDGESDVDSDDSDDSSLEDELALLSEDDEWFGNGKGGLGLRRSSTISGGISSGRAKYGKRPRSFSLGGSSGLPDDPISRPLLSTSTSTTSITTEAIGGYGSLSSSQRTATPETVREEAARRGQGVGSGSSTLSDNTPRGSYLANGKGLLTGRPETLAPPLQREASIESDREATLKASDRNKIQAKLSAQNVRETLSRSSSSYSSTSSVGSHGSDMDADLDLDLDLERDDRGGRSISSSLTARSAIGKKVVVPKSRQRQSSISSLYGHGRARSEEGAAPGDAPSRRRKDIRHVSAPNPTIEADPLAVSFNELPNKAQYLILNELIRVNSSAATSVVLTALPAPEPGTSQDELKSHKYLEQLESLFTGGPPVLGVHAKTLTMTMSL